jgi:Ca2+-binding RTX toxin-like protein
VFVRDRHSGVTERVSVGFDGAEASNGHGAAVSADGRFVAFSSDASNLVAGDTNDAIDVFVRDRAGEGCTITGGPGDDVLAGTEGDDVICGLAGNDVIRGLDGDDVLDGGPGNDRVDGGRGVDFVLGGPGNDRLLTRDGRREDVDGGPGTDLGRVDPSDWLSFLELLA